MIAAQCDSCVKLKARESSNEDCRNFAICLRSANDELRLMSSNTAKGISDITVVAYEPALLNPVLKPLDENKVLLACFALQ